MFNPSGNTLPKCLHTVDHDWRLLKYVVIVQQGERVVELRQCIKCLRLRVLPLTKEKWCT